MTTAAPPRRVILVDATMASVHLRLAYGVEVSPSRIQQWASRGHLGRHGRGRMRYDLHEIVEVAQARGLLGVA